MVTDMITIIMPNRVSVDGFVQLVDLSKFDLPENFKAMNWDGWQGWEEFDNAPNKTLTSLETYQPIYDEWKTLQDAENARADQAEAMRQNPLAFLEGEALQLAIQGQIVAAIDEYMNNFAREREYDSMASAASYERDEDPQFALEGAYCKKMRSRIYSMSRNIRKAVLAGERPMPTLDEVMAELPPLEWPEAA